MTRNILIALAITYLAAPVAAQTPPAKVTFDDHLAPLLRDKCANCHNPDKKSGGLIVVTYGGLMEGGSSGKVVEPGDPDASSLFKVVAHLQEPYMPPKGDRLPDASLALVRNWIAGGALENAGSKPKLASKPKIDLAIPASAAGKPEGPPPMPGDALRYEPVVRAPRANAVTALAASPWAPLLAVGGQKQVALYHAETLEPLGILPFPEGLPQVLKFSRSGGLLLAGGGQGAKTGKVVVWSVATGERVIQVGDEFDSVLAADISADQSKIALGGPSKVVRVFSTRDGQLLHEIRKHTDWITAMEFSPDGVLLATGDRNGGGFVWEAESGKEYASLRGHSAAITDLSFRADGNVLASASEDGAIRLWEMENGGQVRSWNAHGGGALAVHFAKDGRLASCGRDRVTKLWDQNGGQQRAFDAFADVALRVAITHDGARVIAGDWSGTLKSWLAADGKLLGSITTNPPAPDELLDRTTKQLLQTRAQHDQLVQAARSSKQALDEAAAAVAAGEKTLADAVAQSQAAQNAVAQAKAAIDGKMKDLAAAQTAAPMKEATSKLLAESAAKAREAADQAKDDKDLGEFAARGQELTTRAAAELAATQKRIADLQAAVKTATEQLGQLQKQAEQAAAQLPPLQQALEQKKGALPPLQAKAAADAAAVEQSAARLAAAKKAVDKWSAIVAKP